MNGSIGAIVTLGYGTPGSIGLIVTLGYGIGSAATATIPGIELALPSDRLHFRVEEE